MRDGKFTFTCVCKLITAIGSLTMPDQINQKVQDRKRVNIQQNISFRLPSDILHKGTRNFLDEIIIDN